MFWREAHISIALSWNKQSQTLKLAVAELVVRLQVTSSSQVVHLVTKIFCEETYYPFRKFVAYYM